MSEQQFITQCEQLLASIEDALDESELDVDFQRSGHVLEIEFDNGSKIVAQRRVSFANPVALCQRAKWPAGDSEGRVRGWPLNP